MVLQSRSSIAVARAHTQPGGTLTSVLQPRVPQRNALPPLDRVGSLLRVARHSHHLSLCYQRGMCLALSANRLCIHYSQTTFLSDSVSASS
jgi:hypothetical protein